MYATYKRPLPQILSIYLGENHANLPLCGLPEILVRKNVHVEVLCIHMRYLVIQQLECQKLLCRR